MLNVPGSDESRKVSSIITVFLKIRLTLKRPFPKYDTFCKLSRK